MGKMTKTKPETKATGWLNSEAFGMGTVSHIEHRLSPTSVFFDLSQKQMFRHSNNDI